MIFVGMVIALSGLVFNLQGEGTETIETIETTEVIEQAPVPNPEISPSSRDRARQILEGSGIVFSGGRFVEVPQ